MADTPPIRRGYFDGPREESLFHRPYIAFDRGPRERIYQQLEAITDERSLAIVAAMAVEDQVEAILADFMPGFRKLATNRDFTFSMKIEMLNAASLVPRLLIRAADCIRQIRNDFAHRIDCTTFEDVTPKYLGPLRAVSNDIDPVGDQELRAARPRGVFMQVAFFAISGIRAYRPNVQVFRKVVAAQEFEAKMQNLAYDDFTKALTDITSGEPIETRRESGVEVKRYPGGVAKVRTLSPEERAGG